MKFCLRSLLLLLPLVIISAVLNIRDFKNNNGKLNKYIYQAITIAKKQNQYTTVLVGDSVAQSLFNSAYQSETDKICYLATNQAISCAGQYLLLREYLEHNPQTQKIILIYRPQSFQQMLISPYTYQYFVMPFYNRKFINYIELSDRQKIKALFGNYFVLNSNAVKYFFDYMPFFAGKFMSTILLNEKEEVFFSQTSETYLKKIADLCEMHNIVFEILPSPLSDIPQNKDWMQQKLKTATIYPMYFNEYYSKLLFFPADSFFDGIHFTEDFIKNNRRDIITRLLGNEFK